MVKTVTPPQWDDKGTYKEPTPNTDSIRVPRLEVDDASTYIDKDGSDNMTLTDAVTGTVLLGDLSTGSTGNLKADGSVALAGAWNMGNQNVTNVDIDSGAIDGVTIGGGLAGAANFSTLLAGVSESFTQLIAAWDMNSQVLTNVNIDSGDIAAGVTLNVTGTDVDTAGAVMESDGISISNDGTKTTIAGTAGDYNRIGNAGVTDHSLNSEDDLLITGELEVDGDTAFDGTTITFGLNTNAHILGKITLAENAPIVLDTALSADEKWSGITEAGVAGATLDFGDCIYQVASDAQWELAKADAAATSDGKLGINVSVSQKSAGNAMEVLLFGKVRSDTDYDFSVRRPVYVSAATAGDITTTAPTSTTNFVVRIIGYANTADELYFCPDNTYVELA